MDQGCIEGITGWAIDKDGREGGDGSRVAESLHSKLEQIVIPLFYADRNRFLQTMAHAIALERVVLQAHRMMQQYVPRRTSNADYSYYFS